MSEMPVFQEDLRIKLTVQEQIAYMRDNRGIKFNIVTEEDASNFLTINNFYFKLKAFEKNFNTYPKTEATIAAGTAGKYCDLEFAYLQELSTLDMYLREQVILLSLDMEHFLKVRLMRDLAENPDEDGYAIVESFLQKYPRVEDAIKLKKKNAYCENLIDKFSTKYAAWNLVEILSLGDLINFCDHYYHQYPSDEITMRKLLGNLRIVKFIRNAAAHNNCLLHNLKCNVGTDFKQNRNVHSFLADTVGIPKKVRQKKMGNRTIHDLVVLLYTFSTIVTSPSVRLKRLKDFQNVITERFYEHIDYFRADKLIESNFDFLKKVIDKLVEEAYDNADAQKNT